MQAGGKCDRIHKHVIRCSSKFKALQSIHIYLSMFITNPRGKKKISQHVSHIQVSRNFGMPRVGSRSLLNWQIIIHVMKNAVPAS